MTFEDVFATRDTRQDNFRSRLFGMFSEDIVRFWARGDAPYRALEGRPTIYEGTAHATIDFTLERRADGRLFIAEQFGLEDVLSLEEMIAALRARQDPDGAAHVERLTGYASGLFEALR